MLVLLQSKLHYSLVHFLQDSFGTACNVTGDGALTLFLTGYAEKHGIKENKVGVAMNKAATVANKVKRVANKVKSRR